MQITIINLVLEALFISLLLFLFTPINMQMQRIPKQLNVPNN